MSTVFRTVAVALAAMVLAVSAHADPSDRSDLPFVYNGVASAASFKAATDNSPSNVWSYAEPVNASVVPRWSDYFATGFNALTGSVVDRARVVTNVAESQSSISGAELAAVVGGSVLNFDNLLSRPNDLGFFVANYQGFKFGNNNVYTNDWFYTNQINAGYAPQSGSTYLATDFRLYTGAPFEAAKPITNAIDFKFDGAWFSGSSQIFYKLFNNGQLVWTSAVSAELSSVPVFVPSLFQGMVDEVVIFGRQGFYAMDDFTYNSPIPEPGTYGLMAVGLLAIGALARRRMA